MIVFQPLLPPLPLLLAGLLCAGAVLAALVARARGALWRCAGFGLLLLILSGPNEMLRTLRPLPDIFTVALDRSQSMGIGDRAGLAARALADLRAQAAGLPDLELRVVDVPPASENGTPLFTVLRQAMADVPESQRAGTALLTDGEISDAPGRNDSGAPLTALLAAKGEETDRELRLNDAPGYGLVGGNVTVGFTVIDHGVADAGARVPVAISADGERIWSRPVPVGAPVSVNIPVGHAGPIIVSVRAAPLAGAVSAVNDQAAFTLDGVRKRLEVLLVSGNPNQGERTWRVLLKSDPAVQLVHFTILRTPGELMDALPGELALVPFPVEELFDTDIGRFDLIILDQFDSTGLLPAQYLANMADRVRRGGALLVEVGPEFEGAGSLADTPLGPLLPAVPAPPGTMIQRFSPAVTPLGARHPVTAPFAGAQLAPWYRQEIVTQNAGDALLSGIGNAPLLILAKAGKGRVGFLASDQFWLWTRGGAHAGPAMPLLRRCVHWLLGEPGLEAEALTARMENGMLEVRRQTLAAAPPPDAIVTAPDGRTIRLPLTGRAPKEYPPKYHQEYPGEYGATLAAGQAGVWHVAEGGLVADAAQSVENSSEYRDLAATAAILGPLSSRVVWLGRQAVPPLASMLRRRHAAAITGEKAVPLLPPLPTMLAALALLGAAWWRERG